MASPFSVPIARDEKQTLSFLKTSLLTADKKTMKEPDCGGANLRICYCRLSSIWPVGSGMAYFAWTYEVRSEEVASTYREPSKSWT